MFHDALKLKLLLEHASQANVAEEEKTSSQRPQQNPQEAAITLQKNVRRHLIQKRYSIKPLKKEQLIHYKAFFIGNAPIIEALDKFAEPEKKIGIIALSGMRCILLACQLGNNKHIPKIFLVDHSVEVHALWTALKEFTVLCCDEKTFFDQLPNFLRKNTLLYRQIQAIHHFDTKIKYPDQNIITFFKSLFSQFGYVYVSKIIGHTSLIKQSWADKNTFSKLKNLIDYLKIEKVFTFPSNLISLKINKNTKKNILENTSLLNPTLSIHANLRRTEPRIPDKIFLIEDKKIESIEKQLEENDQSCCKCTIL